MKTCLRSDFITLILFFLEHITNTWDFQKTIVGVQFLFDKQLFEDSVFSTVKGGLLTKVKLTILKENALTLKAPNKNCSRRYFNFLLLPFKENKA